MNSGAGMGSTELAETPENQLPESELKQQFSFGFVQMVASAAGCSIKTHSTDYDGVDITIASSSQYIKYFGPQIELQVKCTSQKRLLTADTMRWTLEAKPFKKLTNPKVFVPRFLGVLLIPDEPSQWLAQDEEQLLTKSCMYWKRASELGTIEDGRASKMVHLPRRNILSVAQLQDIMRMIGDRGEW
jgi:hypothetical protein